MGSQPSPVPALQCEMWGAAIVPGTASCAGCGAAVVPAALVPAWAPLSPSSGLADSAPGRDTAVGATTGAVVPPAGYVAGAPERQKFSFWIPVKLAAVSVAAFFSPLYTVHGASPAEAF